MTEQQTSDAIQVVDAAALGQEEFVDRYLRPRLPVVLHRAIADWPAVRRWTPEFFRSEFGALSIRVDSDDAQAIHEFNLGEYIQFATDGKTAGSRLPYVRNVWLNETFPSLRGDVGLLPFMTPNWFAMSPLRDLIGLVSGPNWQDWLEFFFSAAGRRFPFVHRDICMTHAWCAQIFGRKRFWAWAPSPLRSGQSFPCGRGDLASLFPDARPQTGTITAGDLLFVPAGWYHTTESETVSITLSGNFVNASNWDDFCDSYFRQRLGLLLAAQTRR